jgi:nitrogenase iron protein NifH
MIKIAVYGKGGIGKSTTVSNVAAVFASQGLRVMQIGCDPKADSTVLLRHGEKVETVLDLVRTRKENFTLEEMVKEGFAGVCCVEAGGPSPGLGCAGRGIIAALEILEKKGAYEKYRPDVVIYDVLGDVVCGGFAAPIREGYASKVLIVTSGEKMALYAANNINNAVKNFEDRSYAKVYGIVLNHRNVENETEKVTEFADSVGLPIVGEVPRSDEITRCEDRGMTVVEGEPESPAAQAFLNLAKELLENAQDTAEEDVW